MRGNIHGGKLGGQRVCLGVQISPDMHEKLIQVAQQQHLSMSDIVRMAIKAYLNPIKV